MNESKLVHPVYRLRLTARFAFYDDVKTNMFWDWPEGVIVTDPEEIETLTARGAPVERIEIDPERRTQ